MDVLCAEEAGYSHGRCVDTSILPSILPSLYSLFTIYYIYIYIHSLSPFLSLLHIHLSHQPFPPFNYAHPSSSTSPSPSLANQTSPPTPGHSLTGSHSLRFNSPSIQIFFSLILLLSLVYSLKCSLCSYLLNLSPSIPDESKFRTIPCPSLHLRTPAYPPFLLQHLAVCNFFYPLHFILFHFFPLLTHPLPLFLSSSFISPSFSLLPQWTVKQSSRCRRRHFHQKRGFDAAPPRSTGLV